MTDDQRETLLGLIVELAVGRERPAAAAAIRAALDEVDRLAAERDAILRWSVRHAGYIGTFDPESMPPRTMWWARGDNGRVEAKTAEQAVRKAAGLDITPEEARP